MSNTDNSKKHLTAKERIAKIRAVVPPVAKRFKKPSLQQQTEAALQNVPKITNETVAEHREEVLRGARKFKYPLQHSKHKIIIVSGTLLGIALITFIAGSLLSLYKFQSTSNFMYRVTQIVPFPVAKVGDNYVSYENYLFELRRYMHYYRTQQQVDFMTDAGKQQLEDYKPRALQKVINDVYVKNLAEQNNVSVSNAEVEDALNMLRTQNRLSSNDELASVIKRFYDWSIDDLKRELRQEILAQKVVAVLDKDANKTANDVLKQLREGADFGTLAGQYSTDQSTKANGGQYADTAIAVGSQEVSPIIVRELARLKPGEASSLIRTPAAYEIVKLLEIDANGKYKAAHIQVSFRSIDDTIADQKKTTSVKKLISLPEPRTDFTPIEDQKK